MKIYLYNPEGNINIPYNYNHILSAIIYNKIKDVDLSNKLHNSKDFKFFTFSKLFIGRMKHKKDGFISKNGKMSFFLSSPDDDLMMNMINGFLDDKVLFFQKQKLIVEKVEVVDYPLFSKKMEFKTLSPLYAKTVKMNGDKRVQWDLTPGERFYHALEKNLIKKYTRFHDIDQTDKSIKIYSEMNKVKRKRISIKRDNELTYHRCFLMDIILEGDIDLIRFAYDCGLSEKNSMGFGMLEFGGKYE